MSVQRTTDIDHNNPLGSQLSLTQESNSSIPAPGKPPAKWSCQFCGTSEHSNWSVCKKEGKASKLNATVVQESLDGYRLFADQLYTMNHFVEEHHNQLNETIFDKIPSRCKHIIVNAIIQVPLTTGIAPHSSSCFAVGRVVQLQLLANKAVELEEYKNKYFQLRSVIEWITESGNKRKITKRVFHRLKNV